MPKIEGGDRPLKQHTIEAFAQELGHTLPGTYMEILGTYGTGIVSPSLFTTPNNIFLNFAQLLPLKHIKRNEVYRDALEVGYLTIGIDGGDGTYLLELTTGQVRHWKHTDRRDDWGFYIEDSILAGPTLMSIFVSIDSQ